MTRAAAIFTAGARHRPTEVRRPRIPTDSVGRAGVEPEGRSPFRKVFLLTLTFYNTVNVHRGTGAVWLHATRAPRELPWSSRCARSMGNRPIWSDVATGKIPMLDAQYRLVFSDTAGKLGFYVAPATESLPEQPVQVPWKNLSEELFHKVADAIEASASVEMPLTELKMKQQIIDDAVVVMAPRSAT